MLINSAVYDDGRLVAEPALDDVSEALAARETGFLWIALRDPTDDELARLQHELDLPPLAVEDARKGHQRPKVEEYGDITFAAMHLLEEGADEWLVGGRTSSRALKRRPPNSGNGGLSSGRSPRQPIDRPASILSGGSFSARRP